MKILVICQYYYPEPFRISDICEELVKRGHEITVVTGIPNYPMGKIYPEYQYRKKRNEVINGVNVHRCFTIERRTGPIFRLLNYYSYAISSQAYISKLKNEYDVIFVNQLSPVMMASAGVRYKKKHNKKLILYCLDLWPESLIAGRIKRRGLIYQYYHRVSERIYKQADKLLVTSKSFYKYFADQFDMNPDEIKYLPQYAEVLFSPEACAKESNGIIDLMFAGNIGAAQSIETIIRAANETRDIPNLRWHIVGDGSDLEKCKSLVKKLGVTSMTFYGRQSIEKMPEYYAMADTMLVTMRNDPVLSMTLPGKVQTYMAAGKPIIGAINGETARIIREAKCGYCVNAEDFHGMAVSIRNFIYSNKYYEYSKNAINYYNLHFSKNSVIDDLISLLLRETEDFT